MTEWGSRPARRPQARAARTLTALLPASHRPLTQAGRARGMMITDKRGVRTPSRNAERRAGCWSSNRLNAFYGSEKGEE
jgi:hypothetical protein